MGLRIDKVKGELSKFAQVFRSNVRELFIDNRSRYRDPRQWHHLVIDPFVSFWEVVGAFASMSYTLGHLTALLVGIELIRWIIA